MAATNAATQLSIAASADAVSFKVMQSFGTLFSSFSKHPFVGSTPPSNLATTLSRQPPALGSGTLPGVSASCSHLISPVPFLDEHLFFPAKHFACWANAASPCASNIVIAKADTSERIIMGPPPSRTVATLLGGTHRAPLEVARSRQGGQGNFCGVLCQLVQGQDASSVQKPGMLRRRDG